MRPQYSPHIAPVGLGPTRKQLNYSNNIITSSTSSTIQFVPGPIPISAPVLLNGDIGMFSELGSGRTQGTPCREWLVLSKRCNATNDCFPARPKGANQTFQSGVTVLNKGMPLSAACALSWNIWLALIMSMSPFRSTRCPYSSGLELPSNHSYGYGSQSSPVSNGQDVQVPRSTRMCESGQSQLSCASDV